MAKKEKLLHLLAEATKMEDEFIANLSAEDRATAGEADNWSAKDMIAHCAFWKKRRVSEIPEVLEGGRPTRFDDFDHENEQIFLRYRDNSWGEVQAMAQSAATELIDQVQEMSEADLKHPWMDDRPIWRMVIGNGYQHPVVHLAGFYQEKGQMDKAAELTALLGQPLADLDDGPNWQGTVKYNAACALSLLGQKEAAIKELREALALQPSLIPWSKEDKDLDPLREEAAFQALFA